MFYKLISEQDVREVVFKLSKNRLKHYRVKKNLTQNELATAVGVSSDYISMLERGSRTPGFALVNKISVILECNISDLNFFSEIKEQNVLNKYLNKKGSEVSES